uniref:Uncharacterized protein n=1 Tax=Ralstonia solanacearum TaxID=305 RepID=A0A0S4TSP3_RALSL|nr:protein of unknown function [Ralstonia solanacearum]
MYPWALLLRIYLVLVQSAVREHVDFRGRVIAEDRFLCTNNICYLLKFIDERPRIFP